MERARLSIVILILLAVAAMITAEPPDWPALVQKPYENVAVADIGLKPLLVDPDGKAITSKDAWEKARTQIREQWLEVLGKPPKAADTLDVRVEDMQGQIGYTRKLVSFASEGDDRIYAYLLVPDGLKKDETRPAIVVFHQTSDATLKEPIGQGHKLQLAIALHLVQRGYITLSPECYIMKDRVVGAKGQADALENRCPGWTGMGKMKFDASRCVDYLESLPEVDRKRIGCIGHSLGAKETLYAMAFEPRFKVGVFSEGGIGLRMSNWTDPWYLQAKMKEHIPEMEHHQLLGLIAPRPMLIVGGDDADGDASWTFIKAALPVYELLGAKERIGLLNHKMKHTFPPEAREVAYRWLDDWLEWKRGAKDRKR